MLSEALAANTTITHLNLCGNYIGDAGAQALAGNKTITHLNLNRNQIGGVGARALAENKTITNLDLSFNYIGDAGVRALAENNTITYLSLLYNRFGIEGILASEKNNTIIHLIIKPVSIMPQFHDLDQRSYTTLESKIQTKLITIIGCSHLNNQNLKQPRISNNLQRRTCQLLIKNKPNTPINISQAKWSRNNRKTR